MTEQSGPPAVEREVQIINERGLHPRAATLFVDLARRFESRIVVAKDRQMVDGKDIWDLLTLGAEQWTRLKVHARGPDAEKAVAALAALVAAKFHEKR